MLMTEGPIEFCDQQSSGRGVSSESCPFPRDSGAKVAVARHIVGCIQQEFPVVLRFGDHGVFPSSENARIHSIVRSHYGVDDLAPDVLYEFDVEEWEAVEDLLCVSLLFFADLEIITAFQNRLFVSHDEMIDFTGTKKFLDSIGAILS